MKMNLEQLKELMQAETRSAVEAALGPVREAQTSWMEKMMQSLGSSRTKDADAVPGITFARVVRALALGKGDPDRALGIARKMYGEDDVAVKAMLAGGAADGGFLVGPNFIADVIELLRPASVVRSLNPTIIPLNNGTASIPKLTGGSSAGYVGESSNLTKTQPTTGMLNLAAKKLGALVPMSNDLLRFASVQADMVVRDDLIAAMAQRSDLAFIRGDGLSNTPKGMRYWAASTVSQATAGGGSDSSPTLAEIVNALGYLRLQLRSANVRFLRPGWVISPRTENVLRNAKDGNGNFTFRAEMMQGMLDGYPYRSTTQIPENLGSGSDESEIYLADFADCVIGEAQGIIVDASSEAAYHDGSAVVAAFSRDETVIRAIALHDFGMRHDASVIVMTGVLWATAP